MPAIDGVLFDLGGVVMESPLAAIARYERDHGLPDQSVNGVIRAAGEAGAWSRLERGELSLEAFLAPFEADCRACGLEVSAAGVMRYITGGGAPRPAMVEAIRRIRARGLRAGALTNNWGTQGPRPPPAGPGHLARRTRSASTSTSSSNRAWWACASPIRGSTRSRAARSAWHRSARRSSTTSAPT